MPWDTFLDNLRGVTDPEQKRKIIGETFIRIFEAEASRLGKIPYLMQGTIYPDVVESASSGKAHTIKSHHNVGGLPEDIQFSLVEPLRYLFKDEVRAVGEALGLPDSLVWRQPFPGPGLAVRCLGEITAERLTWLREADHIFTTELVKAGYLHNRWSGCPYPGGPGLCRPAECALGGRNGRPAHLPANHRPACRDQRGLHDRRLGAHASRPARTRCQPHRQRGAGRTTAWSMTLPANRLLPLNGNKKLLLCNSRHHFAYTNM